MSSDYDKKVLENLKKLGTPLEIKARKIFIENGFIANKRIWNLPNNEIIVNRELDLFAHKTIDVEDEFFNIEIKLMFFGSCKYKEGVSYFMFDGTCPDILENLFTIDSVNLLNRIPYTWNINPKEILKGFPIISEHQIEGLETEHLANPNLKVENKDNKTIYDASNESLDAMNNYFETMFINEIFLSPDIEKLISEYIESLPRESFGIFDGLWHSKKNEIMNLFRKCKAIIPVVIGIPIVITEASIKKVYMDDGVEPNKVEDVGYGIYIHRLQAANKWNKIKSSRIPIILTNVNNLNSSINVIENMVEPIKNNLLYRIRIGEYQNIVKDIIKSKGLINEAYF